MPVSIGNVSLAGVAASVPASRLAAEAAHPSLSQGTLKKISQSTGIRARHIGDQSVCTSDLCEHAARSLLAELRWEASSIDGIIFVSQTPDYVLPATACVLHGRLGCRSDCFAFDVNLGCSGYVYGLWLCWTLLQTPPTRRVLLLAGDTINRIVCPEDRSAALLFGDAGSATCLEASPGAPRAIFQLATDGSGFDRLIVPAGGFRKPRSNSTAEVLPGPDGNARSEEHLYMDGGEIIAFTLRTVPKSIQAVYEAQDWAPHDLDALIMHQANGLIVSSLAKRVGVTPAQVPRTLEEYGNTSSASIPLTLTHYLTLAKPSQDRKVVFSGFGVGLSWASVSLALSNPVSTGILYYG